MVFERGSTVGGNDLAGKDLGIGGIVSILEDRGLKVLYLDDIFKKLNADLEKKALQLSLDGAMQVMLQDPTQNWQQMLPYYFANETLQGILEGKSCRDLFPGYDVLVVSEPTYIGIGKLIREEFINNDQAQLYRVLTQALAYAFDRTVLNKAIVEPALKEGMWVIKSRNEETSYVYQPLLASFRREDLPVEKVEKLPGNYYSTHEVTPGLILQMSFADFNEFDDVKSSRSSVKDDNAIFETKVFQIAAWGKFKIEIPRIFCPLGTQVSQVPRGATPEETKANVVEIFDAYYQKVA